MVEATTSVTWRSDARGMLTEPQPSWETYTGQPWSEQMGSGWGEMMHPEDRPNVQKQWGEAFHLVERARSRAFLDMLTTAPESDGKAAEPAESSVLSLLRRTA